MHLITKVRETIRQENLLNKGSLVIVGVSGGADSVALLTALTALRHELGIRLQVAHLNHGLRRGADADERFVKKLAHELNLPFHTKRLKLGKTISRGSVEEIAREARFDFLIQVTRRIKAQAVALGHTQDDLAETVLMRIIRGTGLSGLRAILPRRSIEGISFIRPLIHVQRHEIEEFLAEQKRVFRTDPSNKDQKFFRNKIRHELLPFLKKGYNTSIKNLLANLSLNSGADYDYLEKTASGMLTKLAVKTKAQVKLPTGKLLKLHPAMQRMVLRLAIEKLRGDTNRLTFHHMQSTEVLLREKSGRLELPLGIILRKDSKYLIVTLNKGLNKSTIPL